MTYKIEIETRVRGIPCIIGVTHFLKVPGNPYAMYSDTEYNGYTECDYEILDKNGRKAPWLESKMTPADFTAVEKTVDDYYEQTKDYEPDYDV